MLAGVHQRRRAGRHRRQRGDHLSPRLPGWSGQGRGPGWIRRARHGLDRGCYRRHRVEARFWIAVGNLDSQRERRCRLILRPVDRPARRRIHPYRDEPGNDPGDLGPLQDLGIAPALLRPHRARPQSSTATTSATVTTSSAIPAEDFLGFALGGVDFNCGGTYQRVSDPVSFEVFSPSGVALPSARFTVSLQIDKSAVKASGRHGRLAMADLLRLHTAVQSALWHLRNRADRRGQLSDGPAARLLEVPGCALRAGSPQDQGRGRRCHLPGARGSLRLGVICTWCCAVPTAARRTRRDSASAATAARSCRGRLPQKRCARPSPWSSAT